MSVHDRVVSVVSRSLAVEPDQITPASNLLTDLGADSIDLLDIIFHLEHEFGIEVDRGELFPDFLFRRSADLMENERLTGEGRKQVAEAFPFIDSAAMDRVKDPKDLLTMKLLTAYVEWKVAQEAADGGRLHPDTGTCA